MFNVKLQGHHKIPLVTYHAYTVLDFSIFLIYVRCKCKTLFLCTYRCDLRRKQEINQTKKYTMSYVGVDSNTVRLLLMVDCITQLMEKFE